MAITLTDSAAERVQSYLVDCKGEGLRFGVRKTGCSGFAYVVEIADQANTEDHIFESKGVHIYVDPKSLNFVDGTIINFKKQHLAATFVFQNPNVSGECGCGESFTVS